MAHRLDRCALSLRFRASALTLRAGLHSQPLHLLARCALAGLHSQPLHLLDRCALAGLHSQPLHLLDRCALAGLHSHPLIALPGEFPEE